MEPLLAYFAAEKQGAMLLLVAGVVSVTLGTVLLLARTAYSDAALPLVALGMLAVGIGAGVWARTDHQVARLTDMARQSPSETARVEVPRMLRVRRSFLAAQVFEVVLLTIGVVLAYGYRDTRGFAVGLGLIAEGAFLLIFDLIADRRAAQYLAFLTGWR